MIIDIKAKRDEIEALCTQFGVRRLELFGSATGDRFDPATSDMDFLVEFIPFPEGGLADAYFGLRDGLQALFDREIDLLTIGALKNPYLKESIDQSKELLYAA